MGYHLARREIPFSIVDAGPEAGHAWRSRWDSLTLFTPSQYDGLPGKQFPAGDDVYPATPGVARDVDPALHQIHSAEYRNPDSLPAGPVLVVGGANSGCQIARELSDSRPVELAVGRSQPVVPQRMLGRDVWWRGTKLGIERVSVGSRLGRRLSRRDPVIGDGPRRLARQAGVRLRPRVGAVDGRTVRFSDGTSSEPAAIVWATASERTSRGSPSRASSTGAGNRSIAAG